ncbi:MAG: hypothetical protein MRY57_02195 [Candidatus Pacebacteria bacterium]|nr:hypothetical protein [Candidatus Paceibacterota bacterium]
MHTKKHNSHHIFGLLGLLVLVFLIIFGLRYFVSEYSFGETQNVENTQSYEDGVSENNPFTNPIETESETEVEVEIIPITDPNIPDYVPGENQE